MTNLPILSDKTLELLPDGIVQPAYDRARHGVGIVHIGVGAFHKAHQAVYTDSAIEKSGGDWMIAGISLRSTSARDQLSPQDCLYSVCTQDGSTEQLRIIGAIRDMFAASEEFDKSLALFAQRQVHVVTLTITEKGYCLSPDTGALDFDHPDIVQDLKNPDQPNSAIGFICAGLTKRRVTDGLPLTVISCDNISDNGTKLENAISAFLERSDSETALWVKNNVTFPGTMVDRIVPATTRQDRDKTALRLRVNDAACVKTEPFNQWIIENDFAGPVPNWEGVGAMLVEDVSPYELAKLRLLNGPHSAIAYLGSLGGHEFVHQAMAEPGLARFITELMEDEIAPMVSAVAGFDLTSYASSLTDRFANPALRHRLAQVATDGSQKLPQRILPVLQERLAQNLPARRLMIVTAAWMAYMTGWGYRCAKPAVNDPMAERINGLVDTVGDASTLVRKLLGIKEIFGDEFQNNENLCAELAAILETLTSDGLCKIVGEGMNDS